MVKNSVSHTPDNIDRILDKAEDQKSSGNERKALRNYLLNSIAGAGNSTLKTVVSERIGRIRSVLNLRTPAGAYDVAESESEQPPLGEVDNRDVAFGVKEKLADLETYMPGQMKIVYDFARFLSERTNDELYPEGFIMTAELAVYDLINGVDGFTGKPIRGSIVGYPPQMYRILTMYIPKMTEALYGNEFGSQVQDFQNKVMEAVANSDE